MNAALAGKLFALQREVLDALLADRIVALRPEPPKPAYRARPGMAVVPIVGAIELRRGILSELLGIGTSSSELRTALAALESDSETNNVLILVDSPGGDVIGSEEAAAAVRSLARRKHVVAMVDGICASVCRHKSAAAASSMPALFLWFSIDLRFSERLYPGLAESTPCSLAGPCSDCGTIRHKTRNPTPNIVLLPPKYYSAGGVAKC